MTPILYKLQLLGTFRLENTDGEQIEITSKKGRILLAMLLTARDGERARLWLQNILWSRGSSPESLRRELAALRASLSIQGDIALPRNAPRDVIRINKAVFSTDISNSPHSDHALFLEGMSFEREPLIDKWIEDTRKRIAPTDTQQNQSSQLYDSNAGADTYSSDEKTIVTAHHPSRIGIGINQLQWDISEPSQSILKPTVHEILSRINRALISIGGIDVFDFTVNKNMPDMTRMPSIDKVHVGISIRISETTSAIFATLTLSDHATNQVLCIRKIDLASNGNDPNTAPDEKIKHFVAESVEEISHLLVKNKVGRSEESTSLIAKIHEAVFSMFELSNSGIDASEKKLNAILDHDAEGIVNAWRAFLCTQKMDDPRLGSVRALQEEAELYAHRALSINPYNPLVRSLLTHVYSFVLNDFESASENLKVAKDLYSDHLMTFDAESMLRLYTGNLDQSFLAAQSAAKIGRFLPFRYLFMTSLCMIHSKRGDYANSIQAGEHALRVHPPEAMRVYSPTVRYLSESYARNGQPEQADKLLSELSEKGKLVVGLLATRGRPNQDIDDFLTYTQKM